NVAEASGGGPVPHVSALDGLALPTVGHAPERPLLADGIARAPELGGDAGVAGILEHAPELPTANLPGDLCAELEVQPLVVDAPAPIRRHEDAAIGIGD